LNPYFRQTETAVRAISIVWPTSFTWFGKRPPPLAPKVRRALSRDAAEQYLVETLQEHLYTNFYCKGFASPLRWSGREPHAVSPMPPLVGELSRANSGVGYWQSRWLVRAVEGEGILVVRAGLELRVGKDDYAIAPGQAVALGAAVSVRLPKEFPDISPGFYLAASDVELTDADWHQLVRVYWHVTPLGAVRLMRTVTVMLNRAGQRFRLKVANDQWRFDRCDSAVLYIRKADYHSLRDKLEEIYRAVRDDLQPLIPAFTRQLAPGVGLAEEPKPGYSFGMHRSRLLANGLVRAHKQERTSVPDRMHAVAVAFAAGGTRLNRPYLNHGSHDSSYEGQLNHRSTVMVATKDTVSETNALGDRFLRTAVAIGLGLCRTAHWYQGRCTWVGAVPTESSGNRYGALGPDLYSGTSGVGAFLADLSVMTSDRQIRRTAIGAIRQAFSRADAVSASSRLGLYSGWVGISLAAVRAGDVLQIEELIASARQLLKRTMAEHRPGAVLDLISGNAGAIAAFIQLSKMLKDPFLLEFAVRLGNELLDAAQTSSAGWSWPTINAVDEYHLTGLSHGTAGIGYALLELFKATGDVRYRHATEMAYQYERGWFDPEAKNWPDLREAPAVRKHCPSSLAFSTFWCHGAPGIALSRLRAHQILGDATFRREALSALNTTRSMVAQALLSRSVNFSLCHGLSGNAQILQIGSQVLGGAYSAGSDAAISVGDSGIRWYGSTRGAWPCGAGWESTPGLMTGMAGIGQFYLRLHRTDLPSPLLVGYEPDRAPTIGSLRIIKGEQACLA